MAAITIKPRGLYLGRGQSMNPPGSMKVAHNVVFPAEDICVPRIGVQPVATDWVFKSHDVLTDLYYYKPSNLLVASADTGELYDVSDFSELVQVNTSSSAVQQVLDGHNMFSEYRDSLYITTGAGVYRIGSEGNDFVRVGLPRPAMPRVDLATSGTGVIQDGTSQDYSVGFRTTYKRELANGLILTSAPSSITEIYHDSAVTHFTWYQSLPAAKYCRDGAETTKLIVEFWRTKAVACTLDAQDTPDIQARSQFFKAGEHTVTASDVSSASVTFTDKQEDNELGELLYTDVEGEDLANTEPPLCLKAVPHKSSMFYFNLKRPVQLDITMTANAGRVADSATIGAQTHAFDNDGDTQADGFGVFLADTVTFTDASDTITVSADAYANAAVGQVVSQNSSARAGECGTYAVPTGCGFSSPVRVRAKLGSNQLQLDQTVSGGQVNNIQLCDVVEVNGTIFMAWDTYANLNSGVVKLHTCGETLTSSQENGRRLYSAMAAGDTNTLNSTSYSVTSGGLLYGIQKHIQNITGLADGFWTKDEGHAGRIILEMYDAYDTGAAYGSKIDLSTTKPNAFFPPQTAITYPFGTDEATHLNNEYPNWMQWSKADEPEHCSDFYAAALGNSDIVGAASCEDLMYVFSKREIHIVSGDGPVSGWRVDQLAGDQTIYIAGPKAYAPFGENCFVATNMGFGVIVGGKYQSLDGDIQEYLRKEVLMNSSYIEDGGTEGENTIVGYDPIENVAYFSVETINDGRKNFCYSVGSGKWSTTGIDGRYTTVTDLNDDDIRQTSYHAGNGLFYIGGTINSGGVKRLVAFKTKNDDYTERWLDEEYDASISSTSGATFTCGDDMVVGDVLEQASDFYVVTSGNGGSGSVTVHKTGLIDGTVSRHIGVILQVEFNPVSGPDNEGHVQWQDFLLTMHDATPVNAADSAEDWVINNVGVQTPQDTTVYCLSTGTQMTGRRQRFFVPVGGARAEFIAPLFTWYNTDTVYGIAEVAINGFSMGKKVGGWRR